MVSAAKGPSGLWMVSASVLLAVVVLSLILLSLDDRMTADYDSYEDVVADGAMQRGWVPDFLPRRATDITERHSLDSNDLRVEFSYSGRSDDFTAEFEAVPVAVRPKLLTAAGLDGEWRAQAHAFVLCRDGRPGLLVTLDGRARYLEPLRAAALAVVEPCGDPEGRRRPSL